MSTPTNTPAVIEKSVVTMQVNQLRNRLIMVKARVADLRFELKEERAESERLYGAIRALESLATAATTATKPAQP